MKNIYFLNCSKSKCGVYQFGKNTAHILSLANWKDLGYSFKYVESDQEVDLNNVDFAIANHHQITLPWVNEDYIKRNPHTKFATLVHDIAYDFPSAKAVLYPDPSREETDLRYLTVGRPLLYREYEIETLPNTIGSFGFGFNHKNYLDILDRVNKEFDEATIRMHIPLNSKVDGDGGYAYNMAARLKNFPLKDNIKLEISHDYKTEGELLHWLSQNQLNVFLYRNTQGMTVGCSSTVDWAIAAKRPIAITNDSMFRHVTKYAPQCSVDNVSSLKEIISNGLKPLQYFYDNWNNTTLFKDYLKVINIIRRS